MPKKINLNDEMALPRKDVDETLEGENPFAEKEKDYLDEFKPSQEQNNRKFSQPLMFSETDKDENLVKELLRVDWNRVEHIIRGHKPMTDEKGNEYFVKMEDHYLNEYGVNAILHFLSFYLSKEIYLARFSIKEIEVRMRQFQVQFTDFFYDNINEFGLDTPKKKKMSKMFVHAVIDMVDGAYSKALEGKTIELILKQFQVLQNEPLVEYSYPGMNTPQKKPSVMQRIFG